MGTISDYLENELLDHIFNADYTPAATVYIGLGTSVDDESLTGEPSGDGYAREAIAFDAASSRKVENSAQISFGPASGGNWGELSVWAIFDAETDGNMLAHGSLSTAKTVYDGNTPKIAAQEVDIEFSSGVISTTWAHNLLNRAFRNITVGTGKPDTYVALCTSAPVDADTDITAKEPSGNGYLREIVNENGGSSPTWDAAASGALDNTHLIQFDTPSGSWGTLSHVAICSALTAGNLICWASLDSSEAVTTDDDVEFAIGDLDWTLS